MDKLLNDFGTQGLTLLMAVILAVIGNRRIRALEIHDEDQDLDHLELMFELLEAGHVHQDFVRSFIQHKRGMERSSKSNISDLLDSLLT